MCVVRAEYVRDETSVSLKNTIGSLLGGHDYPNLQWRDGELREDQ